MRFHSLLPVLLVLSLLAGCETARFYAQAAAGQAGVMLKREPVARRIADPGTDPALRSRLELSQRLLDFAERELKMPANGSFTLYADLGRKHVVWVIHAAPELSLEPKRWWYPVVGKQEYRGYFSEKGAQREARRLRRQGYETSLTGVDAYSTLGVFRDPLLNTFIMRDEAEFAELVFHELAHQTHYVPGETSSNEGLAEAVSREGVRRWLKTNGTPAQARRYDMRLDRLARAGAAIQSTSGRLALVYAGGLPDAEKRRLKEIEISRLRDALRELRGEWGGGLDSWINDPIDNARLVSFTTYEAEVPRFQQVLDDCGGDFSRFWEEIRKPRHSDPGVPPNPAGPEHPHGNGG